VVRAVSLDRNQGEGDDFAACRTAPCAGKISSVILFGGRQNVKSRHGSCRMPEQWNDGCVLHPAQGRISHSQKKKLLRLRSVPEIWGASGPERDGPGVAKLQRRRDSDGARTAGVAFADPSHVSERRG